MNLFHRLADPSLRMENVELRLQVHNLESVRDHQADVIGQLRATIAADPRLSAAFNRIRPCLCGPRWERWKDGAIAGKDGIVGTEDDDLIPGVSR